MTKDRSTLEHFRERLVRERAEVGEALTAVSERLAVPQGESGGELTLADQHPADAATETAQRELDLTHQRRFQARVASIDAALVRLDKGEFGRCVACGQAIPEERLEILPDTRYCVKDAAREEREG